MNKRLLSIILAVVLALSLAPMAVVAQETPAEPEGGIEEVATTEESGEEAALLESPSSGEGGVSRQHRGSDF